MKLLKKMSGEKTGELGQSADAVYVDDLIC